MAENLEEWAVASGLVHHIPCADYVERFTDGIMCYICGRTPPQEILDAALLGGDIEIPTRLYTRQEIIDGDHYSSFN